MELHVSVACMVPKAHTPFQWEGMLDRGTALSRLRYIASSLQGRRIKVRWHDPDLSVLEAALARGRRESARALRKAVEEARPYFERAGLETGR